MRQENAKVFGALQRERRSNCVGSLRILQQIKLLVVYLSSAFHFLENISRISGVLSIVYLWILLF